MKSILDNSGWVLNRTCNCGGFYNEVYQKNRSKSLEVWLRPNQSTFQVKRDGAIIKRGQIMSLEKVIKEINEFV